MSQQLVTIAQYRDLPSAGLAQSILESEGITCFLDNQYMVGINWLYSNALGGVKLKVAESDAEKALRLLEDHEEPSQFVEQPEGDRPQDSTCPKCSGTEILTKNYTRKFAALNLLLGLPLFFFMKRYRCKTCGHKWK